MLNEEMYQNRHTELWNEKRTLLQESEIDLDEVASIQQQLDANRKAYKAELSRVNPDVETKDGDYIFISWILMYMPHGWVGLLIAVMLSAAMSSTAGEINALASTTVIDFYKRLGGNAPEHRMVWVGRAFTLLWGILALVFALYAQLFENLIEAVNLLGSLFYGAILAVFFLAFLPKRPSARAVFGGVIIGELTVLAIFTVYSGGLGFLWYNFIGFALVVFNSYLLQLIGWRRAVS
jgi:Na+/proline symporter